MKYCPFSINGPRYQRVYGINSAMNCSLGLNALHTLQDWEHSIDPHQPDSILMPCVRFQAELHFRRLDGGRVLMLDAYGRQWPVFASAANEVLPAMQKGALNAWWIISKKGKAYGLTVDLKAPLMLSVPIDQDVPQMLEKALDLKMVMREFEALAV